jgi:SAM-dependent methyltransferase
MKNLVVKAGQCLRDALLNAASAVERLGGQAAQSSDSGPFAHLNPGTFDGIIASIRARPNLLLEIRRVRQTLARERISNLIAEKAIARVDGTSQVAHNTVDYNIEGAITAATLDRPAIMVNAVTSIERVWKNMPHLDVLSIGPRSEIEIFAILAAGFEARRIKALDLFTYSPYIEAGDMHGMPYPDDCFDIVFVGWVLSYSRDQAAAVNEITRVCRNRAIVVIAGDYSDSTRDRPTFNNETTHMQNTGQILELFGNAVDRVYFRHEPELPDIKMVMAVFEIQK